MNERLDALAEWKLSPQLLALARGQLPHPAFKSKCEPLRTEERRNAWNIDLELIQHPEPGGKGRAVAMWEHDFGDGHAFEVMYCEQVEHGVEFWNVLHADDTESVRPELVARSEQGLYYWLFFFLIGSEFFVHGERAYSTLVAAANSVGFRYLKEVLAA